MRISKDVLNNLATTFGAIAGVSTVLVSSNLVDRNIGGAVAGISTILLGIVSQQPSKEFKQVLKKVDEL